jgi:hypothetical protein
LKKQKEGQKEQKEIDGLAGNRTLDHSHTLPVETGEDAKGVLYH